MHNTSASVLANEDHQRDTISASLGHDQTATADIYVRARNAAKAAELGLKVWNERLGAILGIEENIT